MNKLSHLSTKSVAEAGVFTNLSSYDSMVKNIRVHAIKLSEPGEEAYNDFVGGALEVFCEFFCRRYGTDANPHLGVKFIGDTSRNKFQRGYDFTYENFAAEPCMLQVKFKGSPTGRLSMKDLGTFVAEADMHDVTKSRRILFTNLADDGVFSLGYEGQRQMRVLGRNSQEEFIDRDPTFWTDLQKCTQQALIAPTEFAPLQELWEHQARMRNATLPILNDGGNGRVICATGGGKTRVMMQNVMDGFARGFNTIVMVAPTIDLLRQHHAYFERFGLFHKDGISVIHFRTGDECKDNWADVKQTTDPKLVEGWLSPKTVIFVTYASEAKLLNGFRDLDLQADLILWDEFHHTVRQDSIQLEHLTSLPTSRNLFYSASIKRGRLVSGTDEDIYGPLLQEVTYRELRATGVLVPNIIVKVIHLKDGGKIRGLEASMKKAAKKENFDLKTATIEAAGTIAAYRDKKRTGYVNAVTFSKAVPICKELVTNEMIRAEFSGLLETVHAGVPSRDRKKIYEQVKLSSDSVLCQYSVVKEGIDINPFDTVIFSRNLDVIGTQQAIGRAVRANPEDTQNLKAGKISLNDPFGWKKYSATLYVIMHSEQDQTFREFLTDLIVKLQFAGLSENDYAFQDTEDSKHGVDDDSGGWVVPLDTLLNKIGADSLQDAVKQTVIELQEIQKYDDDRRKFGAAPLLQMFGELEAM